MRREDTELRTRGALAFALMLCAMACAAPDSPTRSTPVLLQRPLLARELVAEPRDAGLAVIGGRRGDERSERLELEQVLLSVETHFPVVLAARNEIAIARGELLATRGAFDTKLAWKSKFEVEGFYESERTDLFFEQPLREFGADFQAGYRLGTGDFAVYDGKAKTNDDGELRIGVSVPLLQGLATDARRVAEWRAELALDSVSPAIAQKRLKARFEAGLAYWNWVAAGGVRGIARQLLSLAEDRQAQVQLAAAEGLLAPIDVSDNERTIVERRAKFVKSERDLEEAAILLSLFLRDEAGRPVVAGQEALPAEFPDPQDPATIIFEDDLKRALDYRPERVRQELEIERLELERDLASNGLLPRLDVGLFVSQDLGDAVSNPDDKEELEVVAGINFELPLQRRKPRGKQRALEGKLAKARTELGFINDVIVSEVLDAKSALRRSWERLGQARRNVELARILAEAERLQLREGESDLFRVNVREQQTAVAEAGLVDVLAAHFQALAKYQAVLGQAPPAD